MSIVTDNESSKQNKTIDKNVDIDSDSIIEENFQSHLATGETAYSNFLQRLKLKERNIYINDILFNNVYYCKYLTQQIKGVGSYYQLLDYNPSIFKDKEGFHLSYLQPKTPQDLIKKKIVFRRIANETGGLYKKSPDYGNTIIANLNAKSSIFNKQEKNQYTNYSKNIENYYQKCRRENLFITTAHAHSTGDFRKERTLSEFYFPLKIVSNNERGIVVAGMKAHCYTAVIADEIIVYSPFSSSITYGENESLMFAINTDHKDLHIISFLEDEYNSQNKDLTLDAKLYPLGHKMKEIQSTLIFKNTFIPWERVFIFKDIELSKNWHIESKTFVCTNYHMIIRFFCFFELVCGMLEEVYKFYSLSSNDFKVTIGKLFYLLENLRGSIYLLEDNFEYDKDSGGIYPRESDIIKTLYFIKDKYPEVSSMIAEFFAYSNFDCKMKDNQSDDYLGMFKIIHDIMNNMLYDLLYSSVALENQIFYMESIIKDKMKKDDMLKMYYDNYDMELVKFAYIRAMSHIAKPFIAILIKHRESILFLRSKDHFDKFEIPYLQLRTFQKPRDIIESMIKDICSISNEKELELKFEKCCTHTVENNTQIVSVMVYSIDIELNTIEIILESIKYKMYKAENIQKIDIDEISKLIFI